jgi:hypothetical protein
LQKGVDDKLALLNKEFAEHAREIAELEAQAKPILDQIQSLREDALMRLLDMCGKNMRKYRPRPRVGRAYQCPECHDNLLGPRSILNLSRTPEGHVHLKCKSCSYELVVKL